MGCGWSVFRVQAVQVAGCFSCRVFVPKYTARMWFELRSCVTSEQKACSVRVVLGSITLPQSFQKIITCTGNVNCSLGLDSLPWEKWLQIMVESLGTANASVSMEMLTSFTGGFPFSLPLWEGAARTLCLLCLSQAFGWLAVMSYVLGFPSMLVAWA